MTMNFRVVKDAITNLLGTKASGRYRTIGHQERSQAASEVKNNNRSVQAYFSSGDLPKSGGAARGPFKHNVTYRIDLTVSMSAKGDLATINNPSSTPAQLQTALANIQEASAGADASLDELYDIVFNVLMDAEEIDFNLPFPLANRWIGNLDKHEPMERGSLFVITGAMQLTCSVTEYVTGNVGVDVADPIYDTTIINNDLNGVPDPIGKAGTLTGTEV